MGRILVIGGAKVSGYFFLLTGKYEGTGSKGWDSRTWRN